MNKTFSAIRTPSSRATIHGFVEKIEKGKLQCTQKHVPEKRELISFSCYFRPLTNPAGVAPLGEAPANLMVIPFHKFRQAITKASSIPHHEASFVALQACVHAFASLPRAAAWLCVLEAAEHHENPCQKPQTERQPTRRHNAVQATERFVEFAQDF